MAFILFAQVDNAANQASAACRLCLEFSVETSTPPLFFGDGNHTREPLFCNGCFARHSPFGISPCPAYGRAVKITLLSLLAVVCSLCTGCTMWKKKSRYRNYEGNDNPSILMYEEKPGYPLNTR